jgi:hypothetical protein
MGILLLAAVLTFQTSAAVVAVTVDATVVDGDGRPVPRLGADDFAVELDGQPRRIVSVTYLAAGAPMAGAIGPTFDAVTAGPAVYRLVVQPPDGTVAGREFALAVTVRRPGAKVHAPPRVAAAPITVTGTLRAPATGAMTTDERLRDALATGRVERGIPIRVARAVTRGTEPSKVTLHLGFYVPAGRPVSPLFGFVNERGAVRTALVPLEREHETYLATVNLLLDEGAYKVRFAVVDDTGALGAVELAGNARLHRLGPLLASDLVRWTWDSSDRPLPALDEIPAGGLMRMSLELYPVAGAATPPDVLVKMEFAGIERIVTPESRDGKLVADAEFPLDAVPAGTYAMQATVLSAGAPLGTVSSTLIKR